MLVASFGPLFGSRAATHIASWARLKDSQKRLGSRSIGEFSVKRGLKRGTPVDGRARQINAAIKIRRPYWPRPRRKPVLTALTEARQPLSVETVFNRRESGGIGRRTSLRSWRSNPWGFKSPLSHQIIRDLLSRWAARGHLRPRRPSLRLTHQRFEATSRNPGSDDFANLTRRAR